MSAIVPNASSGQHVPPPNSVSDFLRWSFATLEGRLPSGFDQLCQQLDGRAIALDIDGERFVVRFDSGKAEVIQSQDLEDNHQTLPLIETDRDTILAVIDAELSLEQAVLSGALTVKAPLDELDLLLDGLTLYVHCGVRCSTFPAILDSFRSFHRHQLAAG